MEPIIQLEHITKEFKVLNRREGLRGGLKDLFSRNYSTVKAVNDVSLSVEPGEMVGYLGPNGAGKSTTIKMMTGVLEPTAGKLTVGGRVPYANRTQNAAHIGVVFGQRSQLWWSLPLIESFRILRDIYQVEEKDYQNMMALYASMVDLEPLLHKPVRQMSLGQRTLSDILAAFLHNPPVVFLDEPTIGLDVSMKSRIRELIRSLNREKNTTVILTTHDMGDVDALCKRIVIIDHGTKLYDNDIAHLRQFFGSFRTLKLRLTKNTDAETEAAATARNAAIAQELKASFPAANSLSVTGDDGWTDVLFEEAEVPLMALLREIQQSHTIFDMRLEEMSTEAVIRQIYDGKLA